MAASAPRGHSRPHAHGYCTRQCRYDEFLGHQEQHLELSDAAAAHMSAYDDNPRAQARAILA